MQFRAFGIIVSYMLDIPFQALLRHHLYIFSCYTLPWRLHLSGKERHAQPFAYWRNSGRSFCLPSGFHLLPQQILDSGNWNPYIFKQRRDLFSLCNNAFLGAWSSRKLPVRCQNTCQLYRKDAYKMIAASPFIVGWIYICVTFSLPWSADPIILR